MEKQDWQWLISLLVTIWLGYKPNQKEKPTKRRKPKRKR